MSTLKGLAHSRRQSPKAKAKAKPELYMITCSHSLTRQLISASRERSWMSELHDTKGYELRRVVYSVDSSGSGKTGNALRYNMYNKMFAVYYELRINWRVTVKMRGKRHRNQRDSRRRPTPV